jgi:tetratricopeptide (TPR) repeat protein
MPARQRTLRATMDWSYGLLAPSARELLATLSVFVGAITLDAAEAICGPEDCSDILDGLSALVDASLLLHEEPSGNPRPVGGGDRFRMLQTVREYALARLSESGESDAAYARHAAYYLALAETACGEIEGARQAEWLHRLEAEHDDLRGALRWCHARGETEMLLRLSGALWVFWAVNGHLSEGHRWLESALMAGGDEPAAARARALEGAGHLAWKQGDNAGARVRLEESLGAYRELGDTRGVAGVLQDLGATLLAEGRRAEARAYFERALAMHRELGDKVGISYALRELGLLALWDGEYARAAELTERSLTLQREAGDQQGVTGTLSRLGMVAMAQGDYDRAERLQEESLAVARALGARAHVPVSLSRLGLVAWRRGDYERAEALLEEALALWRELGSRHDAATTVTSLAVVALERERYADAASLARQGLEDYLRAGSGEGVVDPLEVIAAASVRRGQPARAARLFGAVAVRRESAGVGAPLNRPGYGGYIAAARSALGEDAFADAWADGRALPVERAIRWILDGDLDRFGE